MLTLPLTPQLASTFPAFCDAHEVDGQQVYLFKKALFLLSAIHDRFASDTQAQAAFPIPRIDTLPIFADNVLPSESPPSPNLSPPAPLQATDLR